MFYSVLDSSLDNHEMNLVLCPDLTANIEDGCNLKIAAT